MREIEPTYEWEGAKPYWLCPRFGVPMYDENIPENRKCPNTKRNSGKMGCKEGCYYVPSTTQPPYKSVFDMGNDLDRKKKSTKPKSKRKVCRCK